MQTDIQEYYDTLGILFLELRIRTKRMIKRGEKYKMISYGKIFNVNTGKGEILCQSNDEVAEIIKQSAALPQGNEIWVSSNEKPYPCLSVLIKGEYACVHYLKNDEGDVWQSCGDFNKEVTFFAGEGDTEWKAPEYVIVPLEKAIRCMEEFCDTLERPDCIEWEALWEEN